MAEIAIMAAISAAISAGQYALNYFLGPKPPPIQRGKLEGELNIQNSQAGAFIPEIFGGEVAQYMSSPITNEMLAISGDNKVTIINPTTGTTILGDSYAWLDAADIAWASNGDDVNCVYNINPSYGSVNANLTRYWPGKGRFFKQLSGDVDAGHEYFIPADFSPNAETVVNDFPQYRTGQVNGKPAVVFSGNEAYCAQLTDVGGSYNPDGSRGEAVYNFTSSSRLTIFLLAKASSLSANSCFLAIPQSIPVAHLSEGERARVSLMYYGDIDAFGFSFNDKNGDVYGTSSASSWIDNWFLVTAIVSPYGDGTAKRIRVNGTEKVLSQLRSPAVVSPATHNLQGPAALILGAQTTVKQSSKDAYNAAYPLSTVYSHSRNLHGSLAQALLVHTTNELSNTDLARVETILMREYGIST